MLADYRQATIVDEARGIIRGYIAIWGSPEHRDSYGTYFDKEAPPEMGLDYLPVPLHYEHGFDGGIKKEIIGSVVRAWFDEKGIAFEAILDKSGTAFTRFISEIRSGKLHTSSGTSEHLAEFDEDGRFVLWPLSELSLTASPAEENMPAVQLIRKKLPIETVDNSQGETSANERNKNTRGSHIMLAELLAQLQALAESNPDASQEEIMAILQGVGLLDGEAEAVLAKLETPRQEGEETGEGDTPATEKAATALNVAIDAVKSVLVDVGATEAVAELEVARSDNYKLRSENARLVAVQAVRRSQEAEMPNHQTSQRHSNAGGISGMKEVKYDHLNSRQMGFGYQLMKARGIEPSEDYMRNMAGKLFDVIDKGFSGFKDPANFQALRSSMKGATRADEVIYTTNTGFGAEWVPGESWETQVWEAVHQSLIMDTLMREMMVIEASPNPGSTTYIPLEGADPTFYKAVETTSVASDLLPKPPVDPSQPGSAQVAVTPGKGMAWTVISTEMLEDSIVPVLAQYDKQYQRKFNEQIEYLFLNGDTETTASTNINAIDSTPDSGTTAPSYLITNGALKYALVTGSDTSDNGGVLSVDDFLDARGLMPNNLITDPSKLMYISDNSTQLKALRLPDWKDISVSLNPTQESGTITTAWGSPYLASGQMAVANAAGKIPTAGGTLGRLLCISPEYWAMVWKRHITFKTEEDIKSDTTLIVSTFRVAFQYRSAGAATCIYNLTV